MREYENKYINSEKTAWDLRSILWDIGRSWWIILLVAMSASLLTYSAISFTHEDRYTVSTTFTVSQSGGDSNAVSNLSAAYEMAQKIFCNSGKQYPEKNGNGRTWTGQFSGNHECLGC